MRLVPLLLLDVVVQPSLLITGRLWGDCYSRLAADEALSARDSFGIVSRCEYELGCVGKCENMDQELYEI